MCVLQASATGAAAGLSRKTGPDDLATASAICHCKGVEKRRFSASLGSLAGIYPEGRQVAAPIGLYGEFEVPGISPVRLAVLINPPHMIGFMESLH